MNIGNAFTKTSPSGLILPSKKKRVTIYFRGGGRTSIECTQFEANVENGNLVGLAYESESKFPFFKYEAVDAIEVIE